MGMSMWVPVSVMGDVALFMVIWKHHVGSTWYCPIDTTRFNLLNIKGHNFQFGSQIEIKFILL